MRTRLAVVLAVVAVLSCPAVAGAAFPGRDGLIAFTRSVGSEPGQIYVVRPDGRGLRRLTHRKHGAGAAAWAPDGRRLAFVAQARNGSVQVFVKRLGGDTRQVTRGPGGYSSPAWSPDGRRLVAVRGASGRDGLYRESLVVMRVDGSRKRVVYDGGELGASHPAWSPDGRTIAFTHTDVGVTGAAPNLYLVPAAGGTAQRVTEFGSQEHPDWSPDGEQLAFSWALDLGTQDTRVIRPGSPGETRVTDDPSISDGWPAWAPSGDRIAIMRVPGIWTVKPDGTGMRQVTRPKDLVGDWDPSWQPR